MKRKRKTEAMTAKPFGSATPVIGNRALLEAEVERRKRARGDIRADTARKPREPEPVSDVIARMMARHNMTVIEIEAANEEHERNDRIRAAAVERERLESGWRWRCPARYREEFLPDLLPPDVDRYKVARVLNWRLVDKGLYVLGESGRGKTRAVFTMLKRHYMEGRTFEWYDGVGFAAECSRVFAEAALVEAWLRRMLRPDILFVDDLAKRFTPATQQGFFAVLERRTAARKPIVLTTNCTGEMLAAMMGNDQLADPMLRRLSEFTEVVKF